MAIPGASPDANFNLAELKHFAQRLESAQHRGKYYSVRGPEPLRAAAREGIRRALDAIKTTLGIRQEGGRLVVVAVKPRAS